MKVFFISDIHGNEFALKAVLEYSKTVNADMIMCLGDLSGYFTGINEVISLLIEYDVKTILGNHDAFLTGPLLINETKGYYPAFIETQRIISEMSLNWLKQLSETATYKIKDKQLRLYHGGPVDHYAQYIYPDKINQSEFVNADIYGFGHTHLQYAVKLGDRLFFNPGSVGLPRNGDFRAHGILYNFNTHEITDHRVVYDLNALVSSYKERINPVYFHNILFGRSSKKNLLENHSYFLQDDMVSFLESQKIKVINTKFGAILGMNDFSSVDNLIYIASYIDNSIELTSSTFHFNWMDKFEDINNNDTIFNKNIVQDQAGSYYKVSYKNRTLFNNNALKDIEKAFRVIKNYTIKNVKI